MESERGVPARIKGSKRWLLNLTPHELHVYRTQAGEELITQIPSHGVVRLTKGTSKTEDAPPIGVRGKEVPVIYNAPWNGLVTDPPDLLKECVGQAIVVSMPVAEYIVAQKRYAALTVYVPDTGSKGAVRDGQGRIRGTTRLVCYQECWW